MELLAAMLQFFTFQLKTRRDYEVTQAYLSVFLKVERTAELAFAAFLCNCAVMFHSHTHTIHHTSQWHVYSMSAHVLARCACVPTLGPCSNPSPPPLHSSVRPCIHPSIHASIRPSINTYVHPSIHLSIHSSMHSCIHPSVHPSMHSCIHQSVHPSMHSCIHPSIRSSIRPSIHPSMYVLCSYHSSMAQPSWLTPTSCL